MKLHFSRLGALAIASSLLLSPFALAQAPTIGQQNNAGLGAQGLSIDVEGASGLALAGNLGVAYLNGEYFVSIRDDAGPFHKISVFDSAGVFVRVMDQLESPTTVTGGTSVWGYRDGATDGTSLIFGNENGLWVIDPATGAKVNNVVAANGSQALTANPITGAGLSTLATYRAVAYDPNGNGGNGSFFVADFGSDILEIDLDGNVLNTLVNSNGDWSAYGLAQDPITGNLYCNRMVGTDGIGEIDVVTGAFTGVSWVRGVPGSSQGGLSIGASPNGSLSLVGLDQATPDTVTEYRVHLYTNAPLVDGRTEARLETEVNGGGFNENLKVVFDNDTASWRLGAAAGQFAPGLVFVNLGDADALAQGSTALYPGAPALPEFEAVSALSTPTGTALSSYVLGGGGQVDAVVPSGVIPAGEHFRLQGLYIHPTGGFMASNTQYVRYDGTPPTIIAKAEGSNSFNSDTSSGFFSVENVGSPSDIVSVQFDFSTSSNTNQSTMVFDTDQTGSADVFDGGIGAVTGCLNTYRNGCDVATGLVYPSTTPSSCTANSGADTGFVGSNNPTTVADNYQTLDFTYTSFGVGQKFEFDCDTDFGQGITGGDMEGMVVRITLADGTMYAGELVRQGANLSLVGF